MRYRQTDRQTDTAAKIAESNLYGKWYSKSADRQFKLSNIAAIAAILLTTITTSISAYTYPELYPRSLGGNANDIDSFKSGIFYIKIQQPGKATPINSNHQLDKKEFYQAIQKYGDQAKTDGTSNGNVANFLQKAGNENFAETKLLQTQLLADSYNPGAITSACSTFSSPTVCNNGYSYDINKAGTLTSAANYNTNCCTLTPTCTNGMTYANSGCGLDSYTKLLLHFNTNNNDSSAGNKTITPTGTVSNSNIQKEFGGYSGLFNGSSYLDINPTGTDTDFDISSGNFTIDFWSYLTESTIRDAGLFSIGDIGNAVSGILMANNGGRGLIISAKGSTSTSVSYTDVNGWLDILEPTLTNYTNQWIHWEVVKNNNILSVYKNGTLKKSYTITAFSLNSTKVVIGAWSVAGATNRFPSNGYIDEFRISKGVARWTTNFTLPTGEYY